MKNILFFFIFVFCSTSVFAIPGKLGGFSYVRDENGRPIFSEDEELFNEGPIVLETEPVFPFYLNEDLTDARTGVSSNGDRYKLSSVYSVQQLYDMKHNHSEEGVLEEELEEGYEDNIDEEEF